MIARISLLLAVGLLAAHFQATTRFACADEAAGNEANAQEMEKLVGTWEVEEAHAKGLPKGLVDGLRMVFQADGTMTTIEKDSDRPKKGSFTIDPTKTPKQLDMTLADPSGQERTSAAIYSFADDKLRICLFPSTVSTRPDGTATEEKSPRPTEEDSERGIVFVLKRVAP